MAPSPGRGQPPLRRGRGDCGRGHREDHHRRLPPGVSMFSLLGVSELWLVGGWKVAIFSMLYMYYVTYTTIICHLKNPLKNHLTIPIF